MIEYRWRPTVSGDQRDRLDQLLTESGYADDEAGFPRLSLSQSYPATASHLLVWLRRDTRLRRPTAPEPLLAAYLRLEPEADGVATVRYVVRPELRSRGISTLLVEQLGLNVRAEGGWAGTGARTLRIWARGDHPAAARLARRFRGRGVRATRREWRLLDPQRASAITVDPDDRERLSAYRLAGFTHDRTDTEYTVS